MYFHWHMPLQEHVPVMSHDKDSVRHESNRHTWNVEEWFGEHADAPAAEEQVSEEVQRDCQDDDATGDDERRAHSGQPPAPLQNPNGWAGQGTIDARRIQRCHLDVIPDPNLQHQTSLAHR